MDKETYVKRVQELNHIKQKALEYNQEEKAKAVKSYVAECCPFKIGDKVTLNGRTGIIEDIFVECSGTFSYGIRYYKKDNSPGGRVTRVYPSKLDKMEKA